MNGCLSTIHQEITQISKQTNEQRHFWLLMSTAIIGSLRFMGHQLPVFLGNSDCKTTAKTHGSRRSIFVGRNPLCCWIFYRLARVDSYCVEAISLSQSRVWCESYIFDNSNLSLWASRNVATRMLTVWIKLLESINDLPPKMWWFPL